MTTTDLQRYVPVHNICQELNVNIPKMLPAIHALTGCDAVSAFYGMGKKKVYKGSEKVGGECMPPCSWHPDS